MRRIEQILKHPFFINSLRLTAELERDRQFCKHDMSHLLDVARIAYILCLEAGEDTSKELIYAAALLHDTGRWRQYEDGTPHEEESARAAVIILPECGFNPDEEEQIISAISAHRTSGGEKPGFPGILYRADKLSRRCFECAAADKCNWTLKNTAIEY